MNIDALVTRVERHCATYFAAIERAAEDGRITSREGTRVAPLFPNILLVCATPTHFVFELLGATEARAQKMRLVQRSLPSLDAVLGRFPAERTRSAIKFDHETGGSFANLALMISSSRDRFQRRYPGFSDLHPTVLSFKGDLAEDEAFFPFHFPTKLQDLSLINIMFVTEWQQRVRVRYFQAALIIDRTMSSSELQRQLTSRFPPGRDTALLAPTFNQNLAVLTTAANFASLASISNIGETTITRFLEANEAILAIALGGERIIAQPILEWLEGNPDPEEQAVQPDFLLIDSDGQAHICEVKLPLLERQSLTAGKHKRRRFVNPVVDGLAQLANYQEYFSIQSHRDLLTEKYGVNIENPRSILIVGSEENFDAEEARQAKRMLGAVEVFDYDTVRALYLVGSGYSPGS